MPGLLYHVFHSLFPKTQGFNLSPGFPHRTGLSTLCLTIITVNHYHRTIIITLIQPNSLSSAQKLCEMVIIFSPCVDFLELSFLARFGDEVEDNVRNAEWKQERHAMTLNISHSIILHDGLKLSEPPVSKLPLVDLGIRITHYCNEQVHAHDTKKDFVKHQKKAHEEGHRSVQRVVEASFVA